MAAQSRRPVTVKDVSAQDFIKAYANHLKKSGTLELPKWVDLVKTGKHRELAPHNPDWYYVRAASVARQIYLRNGTGVGGLAHHYGGASKSGTCRSHHTTAAHGLIRTILQQLEKLNLVEAHPSGGRKITAKGRKELDLVASAVLNN